MAGQEPKKLTPKQKERLKDPRVIVGLRAARPMTQAKQMAKRQRRRPAG